MVQWLRTCLPMGMRGHGVQSLVRELRSHTLRGQHSPRTATAEPSRSGAGALQLRPDAVK